MGTKLTKDHAIRMEYGDKVIYHGIPHEISGVKQEGHTAPFLSIRCDFDNRCPDHFAHDTQSVNYRKVQLPSLGGERPATYEYLVVGAMVLGFAFAITWVVYAVTVSVVAVVLGLLVDGPSVNRLAERLDILFWFIGSTVAAWFVGYGICEGAFHKS